MNLDEPQRKKVADWIEEGLRLAEIQKRLEIDFGLRLTYLEVRLLVDDLKLKPKDPIPPPKVISPTLAQPGDVAPAPRPGPAKVSISVDQVTRPGSLVSGKVKFSDGKTAEWFLDQAGRLGLAPADKAYKPTPGDLQEFQRLLNEELEKFGL
jgi:hypothetical protein